MLIATDFSRSSENALRRAMLVASSESEGIELLHVMNPRLGEAQRQRAHRALERSGQYARDLGRDLGMRGAWLSATIRTGAAHVEIIRRAREINADLVVMGRNRSTGGVRRVLGTTSGRVVRMSDVATLVVGRRPRAPYARPLIAIEIDPSARSLIELTRRVAACAGGPLRLIHAYQVLFEEYQLAGGEAGSRWYGRQARNVAERAVRTLLASIELRPTAVKVVLRRGEPGEAILGEAARSQADLVALGTHGRSGVAHALLGSIAEWVVANTTRDILVARPVRFTFVPP